MRNIDKDFTSNALSICRSGSISKRVSMKYFTNDNDNKTKRNDTITNESTNINDDNVNNHFDTYDIVYIHISLKI